VVHGLQALDVSGSTALAVNPGVAVSNRVTGWVGTGSLSTTLGFHVAEPQAKLDLSELSTTELTPDQALTKLMDGNRRFVNNQRKIPHQTFDRLREVAPHQDPYAAILSCADSRVPPEIIFDQGIGDLFVVRVAGNVTSIDEIASEEYAIAVLGVKVLMVLGHERCGAVNATLQGGVLPGSVGRLTQLIQPAVEQATHQPGDQVENVIKANVKMQMQRLFASPVIAKQVREGKLNVVGGYYDLGKGTVSLIA
jgi:carbonic anhydrase